MQSDNQIGNEGTSFRQLLSDAASFVTVFAFITGIYSLPKVVESFGGNPSQTLADSPLPMFSFGLLLLSQVVFLFCTYIVVGSIYTRIRRRFIRRESENTRLIFGLLFLCGAFGISCVFAESFWGPIVHWKWFDDISGRIFIPVGFLFASLVSEVLVVHTALADTP